MAEEVAAITGDPALHLLHVNLPHFPWTLSRSGHTTTYSPANRPEDLDREPARLRLPDPGRVPVAQHADGSRRRPARRGARPPDVTAGVGGHVARRDVRPRRQPDTARCRPRARHRSEPSRGVPRAAVHQGAGADRRRDPRRQRPDDRHRPVDRRSARHRGRRRMGVRRPLPVRRQRVRARSARVERCRRGRDDRRAPRRAVRRRRLDRVGGCRRARRPRRPSGVRPAGR